ncbi:MAG: PAS domain-containing sensor histidine kinase [Candidatus Thorarchaeota archaeon]|nr:PAS domain-containing sensor histidine kinase [Candidatus Thorarchaeota archaeon]
MSDEIHQYQPIPKGDMVRLRDIMENQALPVAEIDRNFKLIWANRAGRKLIGVSKDAIDEGIHLDDFIPEEYRELAHGALMRIAQNEAASSVSLRVVRPDGLNIPVEASAQRVVDTGSLVGFLLYAVDMSERRNRISGTAESSNLLELIVEYSPSGIILADDSFTIEYANARLCNILGRTRSELIGSDFRKFIHPDSVDLVSERYLRRQKGEDVPGVYEFKVLRCDGAPRDVEITSKTIIDEDGSMKVVAQILDITNMKSSQRALYESERRYRKLVESMDDGLGMDNADGEIIYANQTLASMLGYSREELLGMNGADILHGHSREDEIERKRRRRKGEIDHYETNLLRADGELLPVLISASPLHSPNGEYLGSVAIFTDVSEVKAKEAEVRFLLDLLLHDIGNQLQLIIAGADLCDPETHPDMVERGQQYLLDGAKRCLELISKIRQSESEKDTPPYPVDLSSIISAQIDILTAQYDVEVEIDGFENRVPIIADKAVSSLVWNLLENAVKHNPQQNKKVWMKGYQENQEVVLKIADNGLGLKNGGKKEVFELGRQFGGVGLYLVRRLAAKYDAHVSVGDRVSGSPAEGLEVTVRFKSPGALPA